MKITQGSGGALVLSDHRDRAQLLLDADHNFMRAGDCFASLGHQLEDGISGTNVLSWAGPYRWKDPLSYVMNLTLAVGFAIVEGVGGAVFATKGGAQFVAGKITHARG